MTTSLQTQIRAGYEPIPGYVLDQVIGRGGFGEVWRASAPGGLKKAVKFVFGGQDSESSLRERRSLERIRSVQHPFLLSLERFEAVDGQLVIVTELADGSLEDLFAESRRQGSCGIPRETLLGHLADAADALDYLQAEYQLQHLDIKPGNLLIIGGHVKVADFGLLKDLRETECSLVGGLTPIYAPPELFDNRPSRHSDQYSLAVMYQELLTGIRPFPGRTIAQLATQHVHGAPHLEPLPPGDRPIVARALEKDPARRFDSCQSFVAALRNRSTGGRSRSVRIGHPIDPLDDLGHLGAIEDLPQLPAPQLPQSAAAGTQSRNKVLVVALGGTGAACLQMLRQRAIKADAEAEIELHSVLIDTDATTLNAARQTEPGQTAGPCEWVHIPLKTAHEYRQNDTKRLQSISRRWIYNVPRSGTTEGMRPLGRLALVDHGPQVKQRLAVAIERLVDTQPDAHPRVYVVGSLSGGTASGIYFDVVHLIRHLLDQAGLEQVDVLSVLSSTQLQVNPGNPIALHDTHAALIEMNHFLNAGNGYPGDTGAGWPSVPAARTPLRQVYLIADAGAASLAPPPHVTIGQYVWCDATRTGTWLNSARRSDSDPTAAILTPTLHSVGIIPLTDHEQLREQQLAPIVAKSLLIRWLGLPAGAQTKAGPLADRLIRRAGLNATGLVAAVREELLGTVDGNRLRQAIAELPADPHEHNAPMAAALMATIESIWREDCHQQFAHSLETRCFRELSILISDQQADVTTAVECLRLIQTHNAETATTLRRNAVDRTADAEIRPEVQAVARLLAGKQLESLNDRLDQLTQRLDQFMTTLAMSLAACKAMQRGESNPWEMMPEGVRKQFDETVERLHQATVNQFVIRMLLDPSVQTDAESLANHLHDAAIPLIRNVLSDESFLLEPQDTISASMEPPQAASQRQNSTHSMETLTKKMPPVGRSAMHSWQGADETLTVDQALIAVRPSLLEFGGQQRLLLVVGNDREKSQLEAQVRQAHPGSLTVAVVPEAVPMLIHEAGRIEIPKIVARLKRISGDNAQITCRLASRSDLPWRSPS